MVKQPWVSDESREHTRYFRGVSQFWYIYIYYIHLYMSLMLEASAICSTTTEIASGSWMFSYPDQHWLLRSEARPNVSATWMVAKRSRMSIQVSKLFNDSFKFKTTFNQVPRTCNKQTCYDPQLQGVFHMALPSFSWPLGSYIIGSSLYLSSSYLQKRSRQVQHVAKPSQNRAVKTVDKLNCKTMTTVKTVAYIVQWVHMCNCMQVTSN